MGNCQAAEAAAVVIQHPPGRKGSRKTEKIYKSMSAKEVMNSNPGHYVALIVTTTPTTSSHNPSLKRLKLLRPHDTLNIGHVYRLVSFEEVLKEFAAKKCVKLGKLLFKETTFLNVEGLHKRREGDSKKQASSHMEDSNSPKVEEQVEAPIDMVRRSSSSRVGTSSSSSSSKQHHYQWRPALDSISEIGT